MEERNLTIKLLDKDGKEVWDDGKFLISLDDSRFYRGGYMDQINQLARRAEQNPNLNGEYSVVLEFRRK